MNGLYSEARGEDIAEKELDGDVVRGVTEEMAVTEMHAKAKELRLGGAAVFFAAMEG